MTSPRTFSLKTYFSYTSIEFMDRYQILHIPKHIIDSWLSEILFFEYNPKYDSHHCTHRLY
jgi:hypothetical protein